MPSILQQVLSAYGKSDAVRIKNQEKVEKIIVELAEKGHDALQVITDFDMTMTRYHLDGKRCDTCHGILQTSSLMCEDFKKRSQALWEKYYPIEIDHTLSVEEKIPSMIQWYEESHDNIATFPLMKQDIKEIVHQARIRFRDHTVEMLDKLNAHHVPVMIFSAGLGDILEEVLHENNLYHDNTKVVSNFMEFNDDGRIVRFKEPLIHMFNKNEKSLGHNNPQYFSDLARRENVVLLGDSVGDVDMVEGVHNPAAVLKIGFLNANVEERLDSFMDAFDVVLIDDQTMGFINLILEHVLQPKAS